MDILLHKGSSSLITLIRSSQEEENRHLIAKLVVRIISGLLKEFIGWLWTQLFYATICNTFKECIVVQLVLIMLTSVACHLDTANLSPYPDTLPHFIHINTLGMSVWSEWAVLWVMMTCDIVVQSVMLLFSLKTVSYWQRRAQVQIQTVSLVIRADAPGKM